MSRAWSWVRLLIVLQLARLAVGGLFELVPQEAYYLFYARHPALSYFDHPGALAWALALPARLRPPPPVLVRLVPFAFSAITLMGMTRLARRFVPEAPERAVLLLATTAAFSVLSVVALPDAPLVAAWTWTLCFLAEALLDGRRGAWLPAGLCAGLAFDAKYSAAFLLLGAGLLLLLLPRGRRDLASPWPWLGLLLAALTTGPVWIWNAEHGWASFLFQTAERVERARGLSAWNLLGLLGSQLVLVLPPLLVIWGREAVRAVPRMLRGALEPEELFLAVFSLVPAAALLVVSLGAVVKPNWALPLWIAGTLWAARRSGPPLLRWNAAASAVVHALVLVELFAYPVRLGDDTWVGWSALREQTRARLAPSEFAFSADDYKTTAELLLDGTIEAHGRNLLGQPALQFDFVGFDARTLAGRTGLFLDSDPRRFDDGPSGPAPAALVERCGRVLEEPPLLVRRGERIVRRFRAWRCVEYRPP
ncbi:MAG TPA: glycosyltransferase family 39 protein [Myxococcaceae bacterium]|nr:glycosyltransferase family 39 protein [Myxococcaceae bacterium]